MSTATQELRQGLPPGGDIVVEADARADRIVRILSSGLLVNAHKAFRFEQDRLKIEAEKAAREAERDRELRAVKQDLDEIFMPFHRAGITALDESQGFFVTPAIPICYSTDPTEPQGDFATSIKISRQKIGLVDDDRREINDPNAVYHFSASMTDQRGASSGDHYLGKYDPLEGFSSGVGGSVLSSDSPDYGFFNDVIVALKEEAPTFLVELIANQDPAHVYPKDTVFK
jgi:hypothetical protein